MRYCLLILFLSLFSLNAIAASAINSASFWANHFAIRLAKIKEPKDIPLHLTFSARHLKEIEKEVLNNTIFVPEVIYKVYINQIYLIDKNKNRTVIDFKKFKQKKLLLNGRSLYLKSDKSYSDFVLEVSKILNPKKKISYQSFFFKPSYAQETPADVSSFLATVFASASAPRHLDNRNSSKSVTAVLNDYYEIQADMVRSYRSRGININVPSVNFICDGRVMTQLVEYEMVTAGQPRINRSNARRLINIPGSGYEFRYGEPAVVNSTSCSSQVDDSGLITSVSGNNPVLCPRQGVNIFNDPLYFGGFPNWASDCCELEGCNDEVRRNLIRIQQDLANSRPDPTPTTNDTIEPDGILENIDNGLEPDAAIGIE